jgi:hypothetical protein
MSNLFTVAFPAYNEESRIENVIKNYINYTDDIIVVDKYSSDKTEEICLKYNVRIIKYPSGIDETEQIKLVNEKANYDWILYTTCSEISPKQLLEEFEKTILNSVKMNYKAAVFNRISYTNGLATHNQKDYYSNFKNGIYSRFINKKYFDFENSRIHFEIPIIAKPEQIYIIDSKIAQIHIRNDDLSGIELKHTRYADIDSLAMYKKNRQGSFMKLFLRPLYHFIKLYINNYKNGFTGFIISISHALYVFQVELRLLSYKYNYNKETIQENNNIIKNRFYNEV